ncbi:cysteine hydrolase family protein [Promicromonospora panici]|uniref:cysteine hydrolase family protein n=1 Tax=Promicromonospora panici TaxID=2219658 RepID=UPI00101DE151|nr:isochorismatase family cysteine hydrolase [Promicromonospora panici]
MTNTQLHNPALVVVDVQNGFVNQHSRHAVGAIVDLIAAWTTRGLPVVFTRYLNQPGSAYEKYFSWSRLMDSPEIDLVPELQPLAVGHPVIDKLGYTLFSNEGAALVREQGWRDLVFCGIATESCVLKSAADAFENGYGPWIVTDACASDAGPETHNAGLTVARRLIGRNQLITSSTLLESIDRTGADR